MLAYADTESERITDNERQHRLPGLQSRIAGVIRDHAVHRPPARLDRDAAAGDEQGRPTFFENRPCPDGRGARVRPRVSLSTATAN